MKTAIKVSGGGLRLTGDWESDPLATLCETARLGTALEKLQAELVRHARRAGRSWTEIGSALGTTRQAAWQRFASPGD